MLTVACGLALCTYTPPTWLGTPLTAKASTFSTITEEAVTPVQVTMWAFDPTDSTPVSRFSRSKVPFLEIVVDCDIQRMGSTMPKGDTLTAGSKNRRDVSISLCIRPSFIQPQCFTV
ncbi:hypothetical protein PV05_05323 [Exophiala xenobiotica]|uniref:Uncharacterized protein n=1 Tax=Exophiala xenobiotica TaxID=348802 RepID=A0A0D2EMN6_9EURO|nr:uncharacterized protein PV05_05323 [Exophiala xenobiotica]KIW56683.1 hypothetical protein PV05_05323 [Exophiala xenobiotica]